MSDKQRFAAIYTRNHECGEPVMEAELYDTEADALTALASAKLAGAGVIGCFVSMGDLTFSYVARCTSRYVKYEGERAPNEAPKATKAPGTTKTAARERMSTINVQAAVLLYLNSHPESSIGEITNGTRIDRMRIKYALWVLLRTKYIRRKGTKANIRYSVARGKA